VRITIDQSGNLALKSLVHICACGHPAGSHTDRACLVNRSFCNCRKFHSLFKVEDERSFLKPHTSIGMGHALIQGVLSHLEGIESIHLSDVGLGKSPECYRCRKVTRLLMPVLMNVHSVRPVTDVSKGKMTRLWCESCCNLEDVEYFPVVAEVMESAWQRRWRSEN
jgi:hypothetical protein